jgi:nitrate reductase gamma subunit
MGIFYSLLSIFVFIDIVAIGCGFFKLYALFAVAVPSAAIIVFLAGFIYRIVGWARSPVPFCIPTICGQGKSLTWIRADGVESPHTGWGVFWRMATEVLFFRSLFRNDRAELTGTQKLAYDGNRFLWLGGLVFHWALLIILMRHLRLFIEPVPLCVLWLEKIDGLFEISLPVLLMTDVFILAALTYLFVRRAVSPQIRYISLFSDYFALFLIGGVAITGILARHIYKVDIMEVKRLVLGIVSLHPYIPRGLGLVFYTHLFLVSILFSYFPFSKLMHMGGVFLSPTRNLKNDSRMRRHVNPWAYPVKVHTYEEWEDDFRDAMKDVGLPVDKE